MKPYPRNEINYEVKTPEYSATTVSMSSRYSTYKRITNLPFTALEVKLRHLITTNKTFSGYYYTLQNKENLYQIAKKYYGNENYYWIIAMANNLKNDTLMVLEPGVTVVIPSLSELSKSGGYFYSV